MKAICFSIIMLFSVIMPISAQPRRAGYPHYPVRDLALIYAGGNQRDNWTPDSLRPYVAHTFSNRKTDWLFDGFLFIEYMTVDPMLGGLFFIPDRTHKNAQKKHYIQYMDNIFAEGVNLDALDKEIGAVKKRIGDPDYKRKVILTLFVPEAGRFDWGELNGRTMNLENLDDKIAIVNWMLNQLVARFKAARYENIELVGMYWPYEELREDAGKLAKAVSDKVRAKNLRFCWIPWYKSPGSDHWWDYGFDMVYQQPNYFVWPKAERAQLVDACQRARDYNMGLEFEANPKCLSGNTADGNDPAEYVKRFKAYLDVFKGQGVMTHAPIAYYTSDKLLLQFKENPTRQNRQLSDLLARFIVDRQKIKRLDP